MQEWLDAIIGFDNVESMHGSFRDISGRNGPAALTQKFQSHNAGPTLLALSEAMEHLIGALRLLGDYELQVSAQGGLQGADMFVRHADLIGERTDGTVELG